MVTTVTDDLVKRIRAEAEMASRAGQSAALDKIADDLAARNAGEAVDREALALSLWDEGIVRPESLAREVVDHILDHDLLAARGDAAPTVTAEQVRAAVRTVSPTMDTSVAVPWLIALLDHLGIEVRP